MTRMLNTALAAAIVTLAFASPATRGSIIDVGTHELQPDAANQTIQISVTPEGGDANVTGFNLRATIGDGTGGAAEPVFDFVDYTGGIWGDGADPDPSLTGSNGDPPDMVEPTSTQDASPTAQNSIVFTNTGEDVAPDGLLLTLNIDTTGITTTSSFDLTLDDTNEIGVASAFILAGGTEDIPTITNGLIIIRTDTAQWDGGGGDDNWTTAANWGGDVAPLSGNSLIFAGSTRTTPVNDFTGFTTPSLSFAAGADPFTLTGNELTIESGGAVTNNSSNLQTVDLNVTSASPMTFDAASGDLDFGGTVTITSDTLTITGDNTTSLTDALAGAGDVNKTGSGILIFDADATGFTGDLGLTSGTLQIGANAAADADSTFTFSGGTILNQSGGQVTLPGDTTIDGDFTVADGDAFDVDGAVTLSGGMRTLTIDDPDDPFVIDGIVSGDGAGDNDGIIKQGPGKLTLNNANTFAGGVTIDAGAVGLGSDTALGTGPLTLNFGATIEATQADRDVANPITINDSFTVGDGSGSDTLTFSGPATVTGVASVTIANVDGTTFAGPLDLGANAFTVQADNPVEISGAVTGANTLAKTGADTLTLSGDSSAFTNDLDIDAGTVDLSGTVGGTTTVDNATLNLSGGTVAGLATLNAGSTLTGAGTVGNIDANGATIAPGNSIGVLNITGGTADFDAATIFDFEISPGDTPNTDQISFDGDAVIANSATFNISLFGGASGNLVDGNQFTLFLGGQGSNLTVDPNQLTLNSNVDDFDFSLALQGNDLVLTAQEFISIVWDGSTDADGDDTNFSDPANFEDDTRATPGGTDFEGLTLAFAADNDGAATADDGGGYTNLGGIEFQAGLGAFALSGSSLTFEAQATIVNNDANLATIGNALVAGADGLTVDAASGNIDLNGTVDLAAGGDLTFTGDNNTTANEVISGAGGLVKSGSGDTTLTATNTFDGGVTVSAGRLLANDTANNNAIPDDVVVTVNQPGAFWTETDETIANIGSGSDGEIYVTGSTTLTFGGDNNDTTFDGVFEDGAGFGNVTKVGNGVATLNGDSAAADSPLSGDFTLAGGGLAFGNDGALGDATLVLDAAGVTLEALGEDRALSNAVTVNDDFTVAGSQAVTFSQAFNFADDTVDDQITVTVDPDASLIVDGVVDLTAGDTLVKAGDGVLALNANNAASTIPAGTFVQVDAGTLRLGAANALGQADSLDMQGGSLEFNEDGGVFTTDTTINADVAYIATQNATLGSTLSGANNITKQGDAALTLAFTDASGFTGAWIVEAGAIAFDELTDLGGAGLSFDGGAVRVDDVTGDTLSIDTPIDVTANGGTINIADASDVVTLQDSTNGIDGDGGLTKTGPGKVILTGNNPYNGDTTLAAGILGVASDTALGNGTLIIQGGVIETTVADRVISNPLSIEGDFAIGDGSGADNIDFTGAATLNTDATITVENQDDNEFVGPTLDLGANTLTIAGAQNLQIDNDISGDGGLTKDGTGTTTLTGDNAHTGVTTVMDGTLQLNGADVTFDGETIGNAIDDAGIVSVQTDGILELLKSEAIGNLIGSGTVELGANDLFIVGDAVDGQAFTGTMNFAANNELEIEPDAVFDAVGTINGNVNIAGRFRGNATIVGDITIETGGIHAPGASIGTTVVQDNPATPGEDEGNYNLNGTLEVEVNGSAVDETNESDLVDAEGIATIADAAVFFITGEDMTPAELADNDEFKIIEADGGVNIDLPLFNANEDDERITTDINAFDFGFELRNADQELWLLAALSQITPLLEGTAFESPNRLAAAGAIDELLEVEGDPGFTFDNPAILAAEVDAVTPRQQQSTLPTVIENAQLNSIGLTGYFNARRLGLPTMAAQAENTIGVGSMLAYDAEDPTMLAMAMQAADAEADEQADAEQAFEAGPAPGGGQAASGGDDRWGAFVRGIGIFQDRDGEGATPGFEADSGGVLAGVDYTTDSDLILGLSAGYLRTDVSDDNGLQQDIDSIRFGPYVSWNPAPWFVDASVTYAYHNFDGDQADYDGHEVSALARLGHEWRLDSGLRITPEVSLQYTYLYEEDYTLNGVVPVNVDDRGVDSLTSRLGVTVSYPFRHHQVADRQVMLVPEVFVGWEHEYLDEDEIDAAVVGGGAFSIATADRDDDSLIAAGGMSALFNRNFSAFIRYEGSFSGDNEVHGVTGGVRLRF